MCFVSVDVLEIAEETIDALSNCWVVLLADVLSVTLKNIDIKAKPQYI